MVKLDINRISLVGLLILLLALAVRIYEVTVVDRWITVGEVFGGGLPLENAPVWMILVGLAMLVYVTGRILWMRKNMFR